MELAGLSKNIWSLGLNKSFGDRATVPQNYPVFEASILYVISIFIYHFPCRFVCYVVSGCGWVAT